VRSWHLGRRSGLAVASILTLFVFACGGEAQEVTVSLKEWSVSPARAEVKAGKVRFVAVNDGTEPHELVIIRTDLPIESLPVVDEKVDEDQVDIVDEIEPFAAGGRESKTVDLKPGRYALICNIVERLPGMTHSHYLLGMRAAFTVRP
jgi:uncharacterized cupredoxin-like copper-binding protein